MIRNTRAMVHQLFRGAEPDCAVPFEVEALALASPFEARRKDGIPRQRCLVNFGDQLEQGAVLRHLRPVHLGHRSCEHCADRIRRREFRVAHVQLRS